MQVCAAARCCAGCNVQNRVGIRRDQEGGAHKRLLVDGAARHLRLQSLL